MMASKAFLFICLWLTVPLTAAYHSCGEGSDRYHCKPGEDDVSSPPAGPDANLQDETGTPTRSPTNAPSGTPTVSPSFSPSEPFPTASPVPTTSPAPTSTATPTKSPAPSTTPSPTQTAAPTKSSAPTISPRPTVTNVPTKSPAPTATPSPTLTAAPTTTSSPTAELCATNGAGFFGNISTTEIFVDFAYELETKGSRDVETEIIPRLEVAFNDAVLPALFPERCGDGVSTDPSVTGISARPDDEILDDVVCQSKLNEINNCTVVEGQFTIFVNGDSGDLEDIVLDLLQQIMADDALLSVDEDIVRVTFVDIESTNPSTNKGDTESQSPIGDNDRRGLVIGVVVAAASLFILLLAFAWRKKQKDNDDTNSSSELESAEPNPQV